MIMCSCDCKQILKTFKQKEMKISKSSDEDQKVKSNYDTCLNAN